MRPNVASKSVPAHMRPCCAHTTASYVPICLLVACASSELPGTIHGRTPTPAGKAMTPSVRDFQRARVTTRASAGSTSVQAPMAVGWAW